MKYLFFIDTLGWNPTGNSGQMPVPSRTSSRRIHELASTLKANRAGNVYLMKDWTQMMSELNPTAFAEYIIHHGEKVSCT